jgi:TolB-like protein
VGSYQFGIITDRWQLNHSPLALSGQRRSAIFATLHMSRIIPLILLILSGCSFGPGNLQSRHATDLETRRIRRIAVLPPSAMSAAPASKMSFAAVPDQKSSERDAPENLAKFIYAAMAALPNWQIVSESEVREVDQSVGPTSEAVRLKRIGEMVYADAVITGRIQRYRERIGDEWGAKSPASVAFVLDLVDVRRGDVIWSARFDETQKSLSENIFALGEIGQRGVRWLSAEQLAQDGVKKAVSQLHQMIARNPIS